MEHFGADSGSESCRSPRPGSTALRLNVDIRPSATLSHLGIRPLPPPGICWNGRESADHPCSKAHPPHAYWNRRSCPPGLRKEDRWHKWFGPCPVTIWCRHCLRGPAWSVLWIHLARSCSELYTGIWISRIGRSSGTLSQFCRIATRLPGRCLIGIAWRQGRLVGRAYLSRRGSAIGPRFAWTDWAARSPDKCARGSSACEFPQSYACSLLTYGSGSNAAYRAPTDNTTAPPTRHPLSFSWESLPLLVQIPHLGSALAAQSSAAQAEAVFICPASPLERLYCRNASRAATFGPLLEAQGSSGFLKENSKISRSRWTAGCFHCCGGLPNDCLRILV